MPISYFVRLTLGVGTLLYAASMEIGPASAEAIVAAGHSVSLLTISSIDQVCHSLGAATVNVLEPPRGGFIEVLQIKAYPNFNALNTRSRCNTMKLPATEVIYQSAGNFLGTDSVIVELITPGGAARRLRIPVTVRPATATYEPAPPPGAETVPPEPDAAVAAPPPSPMPIHPKKLVHHKKSTTVAAERHHPKPVDHPHTPAAPPTPKDPMVNT